MADGEGAVRDKGPAHKDRHQREKKGEKNTGDAREAPPAGLNEPIGCFLLDVTATKDRLYNRTHIFGGILGLQWLS